MSYENGKIYKLICSETGNIYIGSTIQPINRRLSRHKTTHNNCRTKLFINPSIHLIKNFPCNSKKELELEERKFIEKINCVNKIIPRRTRKEYYLDNIDNFKENSKNYYLDNKDKIKQQSKQYRQHNIDKITQWRLNNIDKIKEKFNCECGGKFTYYRKADHFKTKKHLNFINKS